jgi:uncharacterized Zn-finger protein
LSAQSGLSYLRDGYPKFHNDGGIAEVRIPAKQFECIGALPPHDHPHIYLDMGDYDAIDCPYCQTRFQFDPLIGGGDMALYAAGSERTLPAPGARRT